MLCDSYLEVYTILYKIIAKSSFFLSFLPSEGICNIQHKRRNIWTFWRSLGDVKDWRSKGTLSDLISIRRDQLDVFIEVGN